MADTELLRGREVSWLVDELGRALVITEKGRGSSINGGHALEYDVASSTVSYLGKAAVGSATSGSLWQVKKILFGAGGDITITFADGDDAFDNIWDNRASLSYS